MFWHNKKGWFGKQLEKNIQVLESGDQSQIPWIFCVFSEQHVASKQSAAHALSGVLERLDFYDIVRIDEQMRQTTSMEWRIDWRKFKIEDFFTPEMSYTERRAVIVFASFNPNGFIREKAVQLMKDYDNTLPYIMLRQNDWVAQVRQAASISFKEKLEKLNEGELLTALPYAEKLRWSSRGSHGEFTRLFFGKLTSAEHEEDLRKGLLSANVKTRRMCINAIFESSYSNIDLALKHLECEPDPFLRSILFRKLCLKKTPIMNAAQVLLRDKFPLNRILALQYFREAGSENTRDIATILLLDRNASVRVLAREILKDDGRGFDFRSFYLEALKGHPVTAIAGLGETGCITDAQYIERYMDAHSIAVVRSTLVSLMRLDDIKYSGIVLDALNDSRIGIVKTAQQLILKYRIQDYDQIHKVFWNTPYEYTKIKCATILFTDSKWNSLIYMLEMLSCNTGRVQILAHQALLNWQVNFNRSFVQVSIKQKESIQLLLKNENNRLSDSVKRELLFVLQ